MSVVQRCPNCGTTQSAAGECEACHEAQVRYYCTNHEPGLWLSGRTCPQCEARAAATARPIASASALPSHAPPAAPRVAAAASTHEHERLHPVDGGSLDLSTPRPPFWEKLLRGAVFERPASRPAKATPEPERVSVREAGGFLMRLALRLALVVVGLVVAIAFGLYLVARSLH